MKKIILLIVLFLAAKSYSQTNGINYQAVILNPSGEQLPGVNNTNSPMVDKNICMQFQFLDEFSRLEYQEAIQVTTDQFGMVNLIIGTGNRTGGYAASFSSIVWNDLKKSLVVSIDTNGNCSSFTIISNQPFTAVPFAFSAINARNVTGVVAIENGGTNAVTVLGAKTNLGIENVNNTSDLSKPISNATQVALNLNTSAISVNATAISLNTAKTGITTQQASAITANTSKVGITTTQASEIAANTLKAGITAQQSSDITANNAKTGITAQQASAITANTAKVGYTDALVSANTDVAANTLKVGYTEAAVSANTDVAANTAKVGYTEALVSANAAVAANTAKTGITAQQASDITSNSAKTGITTDQASAIVANTAKVGITTDQATTISNTTNINTGDQTNVTGNAATATKLATARKINNVDFDGTGDITIPTTADAGTLNGTTLNATVTGSNLTGVGTITSGIWNGTAITVANGGTGANTLTGLVIGNGTSSMTGLAGVNPGEILRWNGSSWGVTAGTGSSWAIGIGWSAGGSGSLKQGSKSIALGYEAGINTQGSNSIALGYAAGKIKQGSNSIALGTSAGITDQGSNSIALGYAAAYSDQSANSIAIGQYAGYNTQGSNSIAIGTNAGKISQPANSIAINASGVELSPTTTGFFVKPLRIISSANSNILTYNPTTSEISYATSITADAGTLSAIALNTAKVGITTDQATTISNTTNINTGDQNISGIATNATSISVIETEQTTQNSAIALNTAKIGMPIGTVIGEMNYWDGTTWQTITPGNNGALLQFVSGKPTWVSSPDSVTPVITVTPGTDTAGQGGTWTDAGATADTGETVITSGTVDTNTLGTYTITYTATDASGNTGTATRTVTVVDATAPVITVTPGTDTVSQFSTWTDAGATADTGETVTTSGTVDTNTLGTYTITYTATDASGNTGTATRTVTVRQLAIGDLYQGGYVFYLNGSGGGLIAASTAQSNAIWGCYGDIIPGADGTAIGTGAQNTIDIEARCTLINTAADICANLALAGHTDWFLPSKDELDLMYKNIGQGNVLGLGNVGGFANALYWSSSEISSTFASSQNFTNGVQLNTIVKTNPPNYVRAVRAF